MRKLREQELRRSSKRCELSLKLEWSAPARTRAKRNFRNFSKKKRQHTERIKTQLQTLVCRREAARTRGDEEKKIKLSIIWLWYELREWEKLQIVSELSHARRPSSYTPLWFLSLSPSPSSILSIIDYSELKSFMWSEMKWSNGIIVIVHIEVPRLRREVEAIEECWKITK